MKVCGTMRKCSWLPAEFLGLTRISVITKTNNARKSEYQRRPRVNEESLTCLRRVILIVSNIIHLTADEEEKE